MSQPTQQQPMQPGGQTWTNPTPTWSNQPSTWMNPWTPSFGGNWMQPWTGQQQQPAQQQQLTQWQPNWSNLPDITPDIDRMMREFDTNWWNTQRTMERHYRQMSRRMERTWSSELAYQPSRPASMLEHYSLLNPVRIDAEGNRWLNVYFDLRSYKPEEINVTLDTNNRCINVEAKHEVQETKEHYVRRHYSRKVYIPADLKVDLTKIELKSCLTNEGLLCIEAALPRLSLEEARAMSTSKVVASAPPGAVFPVTVKKI